MDFGNYNSELCTYYLISKVRSLFQVMTRSDLGLADAYINGDFSFDDKDKGLENLFTVISLIMIFDCMQDCLFSSKIKFRFTNLFSFQILIANRDSNSSLSKMSKKRCN